MTKLKTIFTPAVRKRIYEVGIAASAAAVIYGLTSGDKADALVAILGAALGIARGNVDGSDTDA
jgi:hypothetical protein